MSPCSSDSVTIMILLFIVILMMTMRMRDMMMMMKIQIVMIVMLEVIEFHENYRVSALPLNLFDVCGEQLKHISRIACVCHLMDKVGSKDSEKALTNVEYCEMHNRAFEKLKGIWDMKKSRVCAEKFFEITRKKLIIPHRIRWMKTYDAVSCFAKIIYEFLLLKNIYDLIVDSTHSIN